LATRRPGEKRTDLRLLGTVGEDQLLEAVEEIPVSIRLLGTAHDVASDSLAGSGARLRCLCHVQECSDDASVVADSPSGQIPEPKQARASVRGQSSPGSSPDNRGESLPSSSPSSLPRSFPGCSPDSSPGDCQGDSLSDLLSCCPGSFPRSSPGSRADSLPRSLPDSRPSSSPGS
jgi:hypothetical protein